MNLVIMYADAVLTDVFNEPDCAVKEAVDKGVINSTRYNIYLSLYNELKSKRKY